VAVEMGEAGQRHSELIERIKDRNEDVNGGIRAVSDRVRGIVLTENKSAMTCRVVLGIVLLIMAGWIYTRGAPPRGPPKKSLPASEPEGHPSGPLKVSLSGPSLRSRFSGPELSEPMRERNIFCARLLKAGSRRRGFGADAQRERQEHAKAMGRFEKSALDVQQSITQLIRRHAGFEPSVGGYRIKIVTPAPKKKKKRLRPADTMTDFECEMAMRRQAQLERIKIYRYQRRADDGTHSVRIGLLESVIKGSTMGPDDSRSLYSGHSESSDILLRNSASEYINSMYAPEAVLMRRKQQAYGWECRRDLALQRLVAREASREARLETALFLKAKRMEELEQWKRHGKAEEQRKRIQGNWLGALAFASFMCFVMDEVNLLRMKRGNAAADVRPTLAPNSLELSFLCPSQSPKESCNGGNGLPKIMEEDTAVLRSVDEIRASSKLDVRRSSAVDRGTLVFADGYVSSTGEQHRDLAWLRMSVDLSSASGGAATSRRASMK
ncbi:hypothetical protein FOZ63_026412, partial [Perkinsus olseni]